MHKTRVVRMVIYEGYLSDLEKVLSKSLRPGTHFPDGKVQIKIVELPSQFFRDEILPAESTRAEKTEFVG